MSTTTANMSLTKPGVGTEAGPDWATQLNASLDLLDAHDHSTGKGAKVTPAGINVNASLEFNDQKATEVKAVAFESQSSNPSGNSQAWVKDGDLYFRDSSGNTVQLTKNGALLAGALFAAGNTASVASSPYTVAAADFLLLVDTNAARTVNLPAISGGIRLLIVKDKTGLAGANNITIDGSGAETIDGAATNVISSNYGGRILYNPGSGTEWFVLASI